MNDDPDNSIRSDGSGAKKSSKFAVLGLFLAFVPALIILFLKDVVILGTHQGGLFWSACGMSVVCCFVSSFLLFRHNTGWAILFGFLFLLLNLAISFLLGCGAILSG